MNRLFFLLSFVSAVEETMNQNSGQRRSAQGFHDIIVKWVMEEVGECTMVICTRCGSEHVGVVSFCCPIGWDIQQDDEGASGEGGDADAPSTGRSVDSLQHSASCQQGSDLGEEMMP